MSILAILAIIVVLAAVSCAINPATGDSQLMPVSQDQGIAIGQRANTATIASIGFPPAAS